jgi:hypothetical protein
MACRENAPPPPPGAVKGTVLSTVPATGSIRVTLFSAEFTLYTCPLLGSTASARGRNRTFVGIVFSRTPFSVSTTARSLKLVEK